jgi:tetratricopeptide (TPR) repeat protein
MALLIFHLILSSITFEGVDLSIARKILDWNLKRYPKGVFFLFGAGRISLCCSQPRRAIAYYTRAMEAQSQYRNLHHISIWEIGLARLALWETKESLECWKVMATESTWSKSIYTYGMAVCLLDSGDEGDRKEAIEAMQKVQGLRQKIAGKSIPLEVRFFLSRVENSLLMFFFFWIETRRKEGAQVLVAE